jgi:hypothetical protein
MKTRLALAALVGGLAAAPACGDLNGFAPVDSIAYAPDGTMVVFLPSGIHLFDALLAIEKKSIPFDGLPVSGAADEQRYSLSSDGLVAAVAFPAPYGPAQQQGDTTVALFSLPDGERLRTFQLGDAVDPHYGTGPLDLALSPHGELVFARVRHGAEDRSAVYDAADGTPLWTTDSGLLLPVFSPDGTTLFVHSASQLQALDARTGVVVFAVDMPASLFGLALTADGMLAGVLGPPDAAVCPEPGDCPPSYAFWSRVDGSLLGELPGFPKTAGYGTNPGGFMAFACSPADSVCAVGLIDFRAGQGPNAVALWRTDGMPLGTLPGPLLENFANKIAFSFDGQFVALSDYPGQSRVVVHRVADGGVAGSRRFHWDIF